MPLRRLRVSDFRCVQSAELEFDPRFTLISGPNASGKTSLLEAVYVLGRGRSFRTRQREHLVRRGAPLFRVIADLTAGERAVTAGVEGSISGVQARIAGERVGSLAELAAVAPIQVIDPEVHRLIEEGPSQRRRFLDWGVFHVEHAFVNHWQSYQLSLKQRNAALRARQPMGLVRAWNVELARLGNLIDAARANYAAKLAAVAQPLVYAMIDADLTLTYRSGWPRESSLTAALQENESRDQAMGTTTVGPHRADLVIRLGGHSVKDRISRGQQKLLASALLVSQLRLLPQEQAPLPTLLLDDPAAELDDGRLGRLLGELRREPLQLIVTSLHPEFAAFGKPGRHYGILNGVVTDTT